MYFVNITNFERPSCLLWGRKTGVELGIFLFPWRHFEISIGFCLDFWNFVYSFGGWDLSVMGHNQELWVQTNCSTPKLLSAGYFVTATGKETETKGFVWAHSLRLWPIMKVAGGEAWQQEGEAAGHLASLARKHREMSSGAQLTASFVFNLGLRSMRWHCSLNRVKGPTRPERVIPSAGSPERKRGKLWPFAYLPLPLACECIYFTDASATVTLHP